MYDTRKGDKVAEFLVWNDPNWLVIIANDLSDAFYIW